ncbi:F-box domain-containing protein [Orpheovirus IHUMI-LCC2]|uniref:F-box domain-containing protein n=1 Tax=Orpheovirus IHUMI-LCC2 TaxID=2023057 RepID=A0A2I2L4J9_9VIRU|nr:F-box domain-containing protein [Orpheovirus IHUMI-LCC2]SNW62458.1 F-box domain-containing protein [Orpheovirus IHUMI-LCC2]
MSYLPTLPTDTISEIFQYLNSEDIVNACKSDNQLCNIEANKKYVIQRIFPNYSNILRDKNIEEIFELYASINGDPTLISNNLLNDPDYKIIIINSIIGNFELLYKLPNKYILKLFNILYPNPHLIDNISFLPYNKEDIVNRMLELNYSNDKIINVINKISGNIHDYNKLFYKFARYDLYINEEVTLYDFGNIGDNLLYDVNGIVDVEQNKLLQVIRECAYPKLLFNKYKNQLLSNNIVNISYNKNENLQLHDVVMQLLRDDKNYQNIKDVINANMLNSPIMTFNYIFKYLLNIGELNLLHDIIRSDVNIGEIFSVILTLSFTDNIASPNLYNFLRTLPISILPDKDRISIIKRISSGSVIHPYKAFLLLLTTQDISEDLIIKSLKLNI